MRLIAKLKMKVMTSDFAWHAGIGLIAILAWTELSYDTPSLADYATVGLFYVLGATFYLWVVSPLWSWLCKDSKPMCEYAAGVRVNLNFVIPLGIAKEMVKGEQRVTDLDFESGGTMWSIMNSVGLVSCPPSVRALAVRRVCAILGNCHDDVIINGTAMNNLLDHAILVCLTRTYMDDLSTEVEKIGSIMDELSKSLCLLGVK